MPKKKDNFDKLIDAFFARANSIIDKLTVRDIVWFFTWASLVYYVYVTLEDITEFFETPFPFIVWLIKQIVPMEEEPEPEEPENVNYPNLCLSMGAAWIIMNTTTDDIKNAVSYITALVKGLPK